MAHATDRTRHGDTPHRPRSPPLAGRNRPGLLGAGMIRTLLERGE
jgi:hypothetical protein